RRDVVLLNAAAALSAAGRVPDLRTGLAVAADAVDSGRARSVLEHLIAYSREAA
ncbi:MAG: anthranilate phosphoribosyltransferase, partial [Anaerolineae bacterium]